MEGGQHILTLWPLAADDLGLGDVNRDGQWTVSLPQRCFDNRHLSGCVIFAEESTTHQLYRQARQLPRILLLSARTRRIPQHHQQQAAPAGCILLLIALPLDLDLDRAETPGSMHC